MLKKMCVLLGLSLIISRIAYTASGGGDEENGFYWWSDNRVGYFSGYDERDNWVPENSYVFNPQEIPWLRKAGKREVYGITLWDGSNPTLPPTPDYPLNGSCPEPFVSWIELSGWPDNPAADSFYVGHILSGDENIIHNIPLRTGGKFPPEMIGESHFHILNWDNLYFFFAEKFYSNISISADGWTAFNPGDIGHRPCGKLPDPTYPNATLAPYWSGVGFTCKQHRWPKNPWGPNPPWGSKKNNHPWWNRTWWDSLGGMHQYWGDEYSYVHPDSGAVLWGLRFYRIRLNTIDTTYTGSPDVDIERVDVWIPVFVIEWCDVVLALESNPNYHYRFQLQLLNPVPDDTLWARFVGRLGRPGLTDTVAEPEIAQMYAFQNKVLIPQQIFYFYHSRYDEAAQRRIFDNSEPPNRWDSNSSEACDLVGLEDENGTTGLSIDPAKLQDLYVIKFDYFKRYNNDLSITLINPPYNIVLRWTELKPVAVVRNMGQSSVDNAPISITVKKEAKVVYTDNISIPHLNGLGTGRWATPRRIEGAQTELEFVKGWIPEEIGTKYEIKAEITWGLDENPFNNVYEKEVYVHCDDTIKYHTANPTSYTGASVVCSYLPYGGSQLGFSWIQGFGCWLLAGFPDDCYRDFEMALVEDNWPGYGISGHPNCFYYKYLDGDESHWSTTIYPSLDMTSPHQGKSADYDGWFDWEDASVGPPNLTIMDRNMGQVWFNDTLSLGDSLAPNCWIRETEPDLDPTRVRDGSYPEKNEPDAWMVYFTGLHRLTPTPGNYGCCPPYFDVLMVQEGAGGKKVNTPYWDFTAENLLFNMTRGKEGNDCEDMKGPHGPMYSSVISGPNPYAIPFASFPFLESPYPESIPVHPMLETYIRTGTYDACLYEITKPIKYETGVEPGYYFDNHTSINFECKIANIGRVALTDNPKHKFRVFVQVIDENDEIVHQGSVEIDSLGVGDSLVRVKPPVWENTGEGGREYNVLMCVNYDYPGLHHADHCPYNDTMILHFSVLWTYDIACSKVFSPINEEEIKVGEEMRLMAEFKNLGYRDTVDIPVKVEVYTALPEKLPDSLLYEESRVIPDLNWRGSPAGPPTIEVVDFGILKVPPSTVYFEKGMAMRVVFSLNDDWKDKDPKNDRLTVFVNGGYGLAEKSILPKVFNLSNILPNPIKNSALIRYDVPFNSRVFIKVYDISGRLVKTLVSGTVGKGYREVIWDGRDNAGRTVAYGIYFVKMDAPNYTATKKLVLMR